MKKAFTLGEILMGLVIIGVLSALLIPVMFNTYGNKVTTSKLKKTCAQITNAAKHIIVDEHANEISPSTPDDTTLENTLSIDVYTDTAGFYITSAGVKTSNATQGAQFFLEKYIKHTETNCGQGGSAKCVASAYRASNGTALGTFPTDYFCIKTNNDAAVCAKFNTTGNYTSVLIDVNGREQPNITGSDVFVMRITSDGQLEDLSQSGCSQSKNISGESNDIVKYSAGCFHRILSASWRVAD